jgi:hypothetical protein
MGVAFAIFHPVLQEFLLWKEKSSGALYMIGWTLLLSVAVEAPTARTAKNNALHSWSVV